MLAKVVVYTKRKAFRRVGRPLTIACHMKKTYFFVVSAGAIFVAVSGVDVTVDCCVTVLSVELSAFLLLHAAMKPATARTNRTFFIFLIFLNDLSEIFQHLYSN